VLAAAAESEEKSEDIANQFFDNNLPTDEFLDQFKSSRMQMHLRKLKAEKMQELLRQGAHQGISNAPVYPPTSNFYGGGMPYPSQPSFPMPMMPRPPY
jgi:ESCRT-I complex subunit VPS37